MVLGRHLIAQYRPMTAMRASNVKDSDLTLIQPKPPLTQRILVADDEPDVRIMNSIVLIHHGYHVDVAEDGAAAWEALANSGYDLLITDNKMPRVSGLELLQKLRAARMALPVIMATGTMPKDEFTQTSWVQPATILLKPYTSSELLGTVAAVLRLAPGTGTQIAPPPEVPLS